LEISVSLSVVPRWRSKIPTITLDAKAILQRLAAAREAINCRRTRHPPNGLITRRAWLTSHNGGNGGGA